MPTYEEAISDPRIVSLEEVSAHPNLLVFADSGAGKTALGGSDEKVLFICTEREGTLSAKRLGSHAVQWIVNHWDDVEDALETLKKWAVTKDGIPFKWVVFDSLTDGQDLLMEKILEDANLEVEGWPEYRRNQKILIRKIKEFNALPVNMLWLALARKEVNPEMEEFYCPDIHGKGYQVAMRVVAQMTSYGYMECEAKEVPKKANGKPVLNNGKPVLETRFRRVIYWTDVKTMKGKDRTLALAPHTVLPAKNSLKWIRERIEEAFASAPEKTSETSSQPATASK